MALLVVHDPDADEDADQNRNDSQSETGQEAFVHVRCLQDEAVIIQFHGTDIEERAAVAHLQR